MKKWFVGLMMLLALVLMQSTAMAATKCPTCNAYRTVKYTNDYEYLTEKMHKQIGVCPTCNTKLGGKFLNHTESLAATCISPAYCNQCQHYYGLKNMDNHNWSEWQPNQYFPNQHYRYCLNSCGASENEPHTSNADCVTEDTCSICKATYKDTTKHKGPLTYTYEKENEDFHKKIEICTACGKRTGSFVSTKHEESDPANCTNAAWCNVCMQAYGDPNPDNHGWSDWKYENENQHYRICAHNESHIQHADHRGYATCIDSMPCLDCGQPYKDPDKHRGGTDFDYTNVSDTEHKVTVICRGCHGEIKTYQESHSEHTPATCSSRAICAKCSTPFGGLAPNNHIGEATTTYVKTSETQHTAKITYADCKHMVDGESTDHTETTAATCTAAAYCADCESSYGDPDPNAHDLVQYEAQAPTCFHVGWNAYEACQREGCGYTTYAEIPMLVHWYAEWMPNEDDTHTAACRQGCRYDGNVPCTFFAYQLKSADQAVEVTLCPVCGEVSDGTRLMLAEAAEKAVTGKLPDGEIVVRMGTLESGEVLMSVAFEIGGKLTQPTGQVKLTLPAEVLEGYTLSLLAEDGTETELTRNAQDGSFVLDFSGASSPVRVIRLVPVAA